VYLTLSDDNLDNPTTNLNTSNLLHFEPEQRTVQDEIRNISTHQFDGYLTTTTRDDDTEVKRYLKIENCQIDGTILNVSMQTR